MNDLPSESLGSTNAGRLLALIKRRAAHVGVIGLGYVGLPLAVAIGKSGFQTIGFDIDPDKPCHLQQGRSYIDRVASEDILELMSADRLFATTEFSLLPTCNIVVICVPTPLTRQRTPDLSFVEATARVIAEHLRPGQLIVLESTTYPGTTRELVKPMLEANGLRSGVDFFLGFSPEREDPGNRDFETELIPKITSGDGEAASRATQAFYASVVKRVVPVSSPEVAEAAKITENVFRAVNIALVNELKIIFDRMGIDIWEVIDAAKTKPFGYMPFYPGPGLGGHCIPIDPFYLSWKSREYDLTTRFIELAGEINLSMPHYVIGKLEEALDRQMTKSLRISRVLVIGVAYKKNVSDVRESPAFKIIELLEKRGAHVDFHDPHVREIGRTREHTALLGRRSIELNQETLAMYDAAIVATDHDGVDYGLVAAQAKVIIDTRNVFARMGLLGSHIVKA